MVKTDKTKSLYPVSLAEAKRKLRVDETFKDDDAYLQTLLEAATLKAEQFIGADIAYTLNLQKIYDFVGQDLTLNEGNFLSLVSIITDSSVSITADKTEIGYGKFYMELSDSVDSDPLYVSFYTGFSENECPNDIKAGILLILGDLYDGTDTSDTWERLLNPHKIIR